jgi:hypothetical protein
MAEGSPFGDGPHAEGELLRLGLPGVEFRREMAFAGNVRIHQDRGEFVLRHTQDVILMRFICSRQAEPVVRIRDRRRHETLGERTVHGAAIPRLDAVDMRLTQRENRTA